MLSGTEPLEIFKVKEAYECIENEHLRHVGVAERLRGGIHLDVFIKFDEASNDHKRMEVLQVLEFLVKKLKNLPVDLLHRVENAANQIVSECCQRILSHVSTPPPRRLPFGAGPQKKLIMLLTRLARVAAPDARGKCMDLLVEIVRAVRIERITTAATRASQETSPSRWQRSPTQGLASDEQFGQEDDGSEEDPAEDSSTSETAGQVPNGRLPLLTTLSLLIRCGAIAGSLHGPPPHHARERSMFSQDPRFWKKFLATMSRLLCVFTKHGLWLLVEKSCVATTNAARSNPLMPTELLARRSMLCKVTAGATSVVEDSTMEMVERQRIAGAVCDLLTSVLYDQRVVEHVDDEFPTVTEKVDNATVFASKFAEELARFTPSILRVALLKPGKLWSKAATLLKTWGPHLVMERMFDPLDKSAHSLSRSASEVTDFQPCWTLLGALRDIAERESWREAYEGVRQCFAGLWSGSRCSLHDWVAQAPDGRAPQRDAMLSTLSELVIGTSDVVYERFPTFVGEYWYGQGVYLVEDHVEFIDELCLAGLHPSFVKARLEDMGTLQHIYRFGWAYAAHHVARLDAMTTDDVASTFRTELATWIRELQVEGLSSREIFEEYCVAILDIACHNASWSEGVEPMVASDADKLGEVSSKSQWFPQDVASHPTVAALTCGASTRRDDLKGSSESVEGGDEVDHASLTLAKVGIWFHGCLSVDLDSVRLPSQYATDRRSKLEQLFQADVRWSYSIDFGRDAGLHLSPPWQSMVALDRARGERNLELRARLQRATPRRVVALFHLDQSSLDFGVLDTYHCNDDGEDTVAFAELQLEPHYSVRRRHGDCESEDQRYTVPTTCWRSLVEDSRRLQGVPSNGMAAKADAVQAVYGAQAEGFRHRRGREKAKGPRFRVQDEEVLEQLVLKAHIGVVADASFLGYFVVTDEDPPL